MIKPDSVVFSTMAENPAKNVMQMIEAADAVVEDAAAELSGDTFSDLS